MREDMQVEEENLMQSGRSGGSIDIDRTVCIREGICNGSTARHFGQYAGCRLSSG